MKKMSKEKIIELANKALLSGNPYIDKATKFFVDKVETYLIFDEVMSLEQINNEYHKTVQKDIERGYKDRMVGYYDKWCRYSRIDEGRAYDLGVKFALEQNDCPDEMHIIECIH